VENDTYLHNTVAFIADDDKDNFIMSSSYTMDQLDSLLKPLNGITQDGSLVINDVLNISNVWGKRARKHPFLKVSGLRRTLLNLRAMAERAIYLVSQGYSVHLIEGVTHDDVIAENDIDICYSFGALLYMEDITKPKIRKINARYPVGSSPPNVEDDHKMSVLTQKIRNRKITPVLSSPLVSQGYKDVKLVMNHNESNEMKPEFDRVDSYINSIRELDSKQMSMVIDDLSKRVYYNHAPLRSYPGKLSDDDARDLSRMVRNNNVESSIIFENFFSKLTTDQDDYLYASHVNGILSQGELKGSVRFPLLKYNTQCISLKASIDAVEMSQCDPMHELIREAYYTALKVKVTPVVNTLSNFLRVQMCFDKNNQLLNICKFTITKYAKERGISSIRDLVDSSWFSPSFNKAWKEDNGTNTPSDMEHTYSQMKSSLTKMTDQTISLKSLKKILTVDNNAPGILGDTASIMLKQLQILDGMVITQVLAQHQDISIGASKAMIMAKIKLKTKMDGKVHNQRGAYKSNHCYFSLTNIPNREGYLITGINHPIGSEVKTTIKVIGNIDRHIISCLNCNDEGNSQPFWSWSNADANWGVTILSKFIAVAIQQLDEAVVNHYREDIYNQCLNTICFTGLYMLVNSFKLSQVSETIRYLVNASLGYGAGIKQLLEKLDWWKPTYFIEKLYYYRMIKAAWGSIILKSTGNSSLITEKYIVNKQVGRGEFIRTTDMAWTISMPQDEIYVLSDQHLYNSFYYDRFLTINRSNKLMSESLVMLKQLENRELFIQSLDTKAERPFELANLPMRAPKGDDMVKLLLDSIPSDKKLGRFETSTLFVIFAAVYSDRVTKTVDDHSKIEDVIRTSNLNQALNNRGSVNDAGSLGVQSTLDYDDMDRGSDYYKAKLKRVQGKVKFINDAKIRAFGVGSKVLPLPKKLQGAETQDGKCYVNCTISKYMTTQSQRYKSASLQELTKPELFAERREATKLTSKMIEDVATKDMNIWQIIVKCIQDNALFVAKMVHKDQIGVREIAVLNANMRICCMMIENVARSIRDCENVRGPNHNSDNTNIVEHPDKDKIVQNSFEESLRLDRDINSVTYDSADCSKWGPSMLAYNLYGTLGVRINDKNIRHILKELFILFSNKIFKIPDCMFLKYNIAKVKGISTETTVGRVYSKLDEFSKEPRMGNISRQLMFASEGMFQGVLTCASSVLGADMQRIVNEVLRVRHSKIGLIIKSHITSDDYSRIIAYNKTKSQNHFDIISDVVNVTTQLAGIGGVYRSLPKSTLSSSIWEFNSTFYTKHGTILPDIKSRASFVDYSPNVDIYPSALRINAQAAEYLRHHGSFIGANWIRALNTWLHIESYGLTKLYYSIKEGIYHIPLELGGLPERSLIASVSSSKLAAIVDNYGSYLGKYGSYDSLTNLQSMFEPGSGVINADEYMNEDGELTRKLNVDEEGFDYSNVPSATRSKMINMRRRFGTKSERLFRNVLAQIPINLYMEVMLSSKTTESFITSIFSNVQREASLKPAQGSAHRLACRLTGFETESFYCNDPKLLEMLKPKEKSKSLYSMRELTDLGKKCYEKKVLESTINEWPRDVSDAPYGVHLKKILEEKFLADEAMSSYRVVKVLVNDAFKLSQPVLNNYMMEETANEILKNFIEKNKPSEPNSLNLSNFFTTTLVVLEQLKSLLYRKQYLQLVPEFAQDASLPLSIKIVLSNFIEGGKAVVRLDKYPEATIEQREALITYKKLLKNKLDINNKVLDDLKVKYYPDVISSAMWEVMKDRNNSNQMVGRRVSGYDLTRLVNWYKGLDPTVNRDWRLSQEYLSLLTAAQAKSTSTKSNYVVTLNDIKFSSDARQVVWFGKTVVWQYPHTNSKGEVDRLEMIELVGNKYFHTHLAKRAEDFPMVSESQHDQHCFVLMNNVGHTECRLELRYNTLMLFAKVIDQFVPIAVLYSGLQVSTDVYLVGIDGDFFSPAVFDGLRRAVYEPTIISGLNDEKVITSSSPSSVTENSPVEAESENDHSIVDFGFGGNIDFGFTMGDFDSLRESMTQQTIDEEEGEEVAIEEEDYEHESVFSALSLLDEPLSNLDLMQGKVVAKELLLSQVPAAVMELYKPLANSLLDSSQATTKNRKFVHSHAKYKASLKNRNLQVISVRLPITAVKSIYLPSTSYAFDQLIEDLHGLDPILRDSILIPLMKSLSELNVLKKYFLGNSTEPQDLF